MKKSIKINQILVTVISISIMLTSPIVFAADDSSIKVPCGKKLKQA
jgi:hypothetical protein